MKRLVLSISLALLALGLEGAPLTPFQAVERMNTGRRGKAGHARLAASPVYTQFSKNGIPTVYVFNNADGKGFRILSADDSAYPVLGYSDTGTVDSGSLDPGFKAWLTEMGSQISAAAGAGAQTAAPEPPAYGDLERIQPMVMTHWHQGAPFDAKAPEGVDSEGNPRGSRAGSAAVAMAQLMDYFRYPAKGQGQVSYDWSVWTYDGTRTTRLELDLSSVDLDWSRMSDTYGPGTYTDGQADAVAALMQAAGYSVGTKYTFGALGADHVSCASVSRSLREHFGYDAGTRLDWRSYHPATEWGRMMHDNLKNVGPLLMLLEGWYPWAFVCDGYDGEGYFHFNWGCGGRYDGYYLVEALNPNSDGHLQDGDLGGVFGLGAVFGAQPPTGREPEVVPDNLISDRNVSLRLTEDGRLLFDVGHVGNRMDHRSRLGAGILVEPEEGTPGEPKVEAVRMSGLDEIGMEPLETLSAVAEWGPADISGLSDGRYRVTCVVRDLNRTDAPYVPLFGGYGRINYGYLDIKDGNADVENVKVTGDGYDLKAEALEALSPIYDGRKASFRLRLRNDNDMEVTKVLRICLYDVCGSDDYGYDGGEVVYTVPANSEREFEVVCGFTGKLYSYKQKFPAGFKLNVEDNTGKAINRFGFGTVTMNARSPMAELTADGLRIDDCRVEEEDVAGETVPVYQVPAEMFRATAGYMVGPGYFDGTLSFGVYVHNPMVPEVLDPVSPGLYREQRFTDGDVDGTVTADIDFSEGVPGIVYVLGVDYTQCQWPLVFGSEGNELDRVHFRLLSSGINGVAEDADSAAPMYNLQGQVVDPATTGPGIYIRNGKKIVKNR